MIPSKSVLILLTLAACLTIGEAGQSKNRNNLFEPIYAFDDSDVHSVSAGQAPARAPTTSGASSGSPSLSTLAASATTPKQPQRPTIFDNDDAFDDQSSSSSLSHVPLGTIQSSLPSIQRPLTTQAGAKTAGSQAGGDKETFKFKQQEQEPARHWSALENYYQKLRQISMPARQQQQHQQSSNYQLPIYQILQQQQQQEVDDSLAAYKPLLANSNNNSPYAINSLYTLNAKSPSAFQLPVVASSSPASSNQPQQTHVQQAAVADPSFNVHKFTAPGVSRTGGIGSSSILLSAQGNQFDSFGQQTIQDPVKSFQQRQPFLIQSWPTQSVSEESIPTSSGLDDSNIRFLEWRKLPEQLLLQQQQQRVKHQQETFGSWYDHQRSRELLQEEAFCGPRNYANFNAPRVGTLKGSTLANPKSLSKLKFQLDSLLPATGASTAINQMDAPVALSAGEYPSHMGIYNNSSLDDGNFLCAATYIHEQFALTLASCLRTVLDPKKLVVRSNEWNLKKNVSAELKNSMVTRDIEQIYLFPKYRPDSPEHNLALVKFSKPIEYLELPYICPACQMQPRTALRTSSCWTPIRNITFSEYFDADGEGETKEKKTVNMIEMPVRLIANDDSECFKQTKVEFFNFQHPNYICSANYKTSPWRARLNQTEYFGSGIYCNEGGNLNLVSIVHPIQANSPSTYGYMDLSYYKPWMRNVISGRNF